MDQLLITPPPFGAPALRAYIAHRSGPIHRPPNQKYISSVRYFRQCFYPDKDATRKIYLEVAPYTLATFPVTVLTYDPDVQNPNIVKYC